LSVGRCIARAVVLALALACAACPKRLPRDAGEQLEPNPAAGTEQPQPPPAPVPAPGAEPRPDGPTAEDDRIRGAITRGHELIATLGGRELSDDQRLQADTAAAFLVQAQQALDEGDAQRASVLSEKGLILLEDVELQTRPR
jgi:hypothetical protein